MRPAMRLLQVLTMSVWVGGLVFFAFVLAPTAFHRLPVHEAGLVVGESLRIFDYLELGCGVLFLAATALLSRGVEMRIKGRYEMELLLALAMILGTGYLAWNVLPAMDQDQRQAGGDIQLVEATNPARLHFERLHKRSEKTAGTVLLLGLAALFLISREGIPQASITGD